MQATKVAARLTKNSVRSVMGGFSGSSRLQLRGNPTKMPYAVRLSLRARRLLRMLPRMSEDSKKSPPSEEDESEAEAPESEDKPNEPEAPESEAPESEDEPEVRKARSDEDADEDDDAEAEAPPPKPAKKRKRKRAAADVAKARAAGPRRRARVELPPEDVIDTPSRQTLGMMGAMALATLIMWGSAKLACNAHPAQTRKPREVATADLARDPKGAALEMAQRWAAYDFDGATQLASGPVAQAIAQAKNACAAKAAECETQKKAVEGRALATVDLLARDGGRATVRVNGLGGALEAKSALYEVELDGKTWKVAKTTDQVPAPKPVIEVPAVDAGAGEAP